MLARAWFVLVLLACTSAWSQVDSTETATDTADEVQLQVPPPVSGQAYPSEFAGETPSNVLRGGLGFSSAYCEQRLGIWQLPARKRRHLLDLAYDCPR